MAGVDISGSGVAGRPRGFGQARAKARLTPALAQALLIAALVAVTYMLSLAGSGFIARVAFIGGAAGLAVFYRRRSPWLYLTVVFWFWTVTPMARRMINLHTGFNPTDLVLATPNIISVLIVLDLLRSGDVLRRPEALGPLGVIACVLYGFAYSLINGQMFVGAIGMMDWLIPVLYFLFILEHVARIDDAEVHLRSFLIINGMFITGYGVLQALQPPAWDVAWSLASGMGSKEEVNNSGAWRVFGTLNETGVFAFWLATLIVLSLHFRTIMSLVILPAAGLLLLMTNMRSMLGSLVLSLCVAGAIGGQRVSRGLVSIGAATVVLGLLFGSLNPNVVDRLASRYSSLTDLQDDDSALTRAEIWRHSPQMIDNHPWGLGLGAIGRGAVVTNDYDLVHVDFGVLVIFLTLGWVAGSLYMISMLAAVATAVWSAWRSKDPVATSFAAAAVGMVALLPLLNVVGFGGAILWLSAGFGTAFGMRSVRRKPASASSPSVDLGPRRHIREGWKLSK